MDKVLYGITGFIATDKSFAVYSMIPVTGTFSMPL